MVTTTINLAFGAVILILGIIGFLRSREMWVLWIGIAFGFFAITHLFTLLDMTDSLSALILVLRIIGYAIIALTVAWVGFRQ